MNCLEKLRLGEDMTQLEMATALGVSKSLYIKIEGGLRKPSREFLMKVKEKYPLCDMNIFFTELLHETC